MGMKTLLLDGNDFSTLLSFYSAVEKVFTKDLGWKIGRNLDAFNDVLRGGFGIGACQPINMPEDFWQIEHIDQQSSIKPLTDFVSYEIIYPFYN